MTHADSLTGWESRVTGASRPRLFPDHAPDPAGDLAAKAAALLSVPVTDLSPDQLLDAIVEYRDVLRQLLAIR